MNGFSEHNLPRGWKSVPFVEALERIPSPRPAKIQAREYRAHGRVPVIDQGQSFIAGWTDDESGAISSDLPYIVFGDHTRTFKFVDFPFALGADGTQLLKPTHDFAPKFFYYACLGLHLPSRGYNRHFGLLKEQHLPCPPLREQEAIGDQLSLVETGIDLATRRLMTLEQIKSSMLARFFDSDSPRTKVPLERVATTASGGTPSRHQAGLFGGDTLWVKSGELDDGFIDRTEETITNVGLKRSSAKLFPPGTLLVAMYGATVGKTGILRVPAATNQAICAIFPDDSRLDTRFLRYQLIHDRPALLRARYGGAQPNISQQVIRSHEVWVPTLEEQEEIGDALESVDAALTAHRRKLDVLRDLFETLLAKLVGGEVRLQAEGREVASA